MEFIDNLAAFVAAIWVMAVFGLMVNYYSTEWKLVRREDSEDRP